MITEIDAGLLVTRAVLAAVFLTAGIAKLADRAGSRAALLGFGLPASLAAPFGVLLPLVELTVAVALLPAASSRWGALGALVLLVLFLAGIANVMARGRKAECHCFGRLHSAPVGWSTLGRAVILASVAGFILVAGKDGTSPSYLAWLNGLGTAELVALLVGGFALALLGGGGWFALHLLRQHGRVLLRLDGLERELAEHGFISAPSGIDSQRVGGLALGTRAPGFELPGLHGKSTTLEELLAPGLPVMLVFAHPHCTPCTAMLPEIGGWQRTHGAELTVALVSQGTIDDNRVVAAEHGIERVVVQQHREVADAYEAYATPSGLVVTPEGAIASPVAQGASEMRELLRATLVAGLPSVHREKDSRQVDPQPAVSLDVH